ncbi:hypothetical protein SPONL_494 [uncultured Candidatus Thioglobus sp.]|nr:hypothetical protein SPONL_494 [uncultured Candidatus Thioglobus sp.]
MNKVNQFITVNASLSRSINVERDDNDQQALKAYVLTNNAMTALNDTINACNTKQNSSKAFAIVGPYGSGKSAFALYLSHLLSNNSQAVDKLPTLLKKQFSAHLDSSSGYLKLLLSGSPEPLIQTFLQTLKSSIKPYYQQLGITEKTELNTIDKLLSTQEISIKEVVNLIKKIRLTIQNAGGKGLFIVIDELGKFLEYSARHESDDIFLLQVLAEETYTTDKANVLLFVLLHQSFEQYGKNLDSKLKNEWIKIQGRYQTLSFVDTTAELLPIIAQVFQQKLPKTSKQSIKNEIAAITKTLKQQNILPSTLETSKANGLFLQCYPLHPLTLLLLPVLCQKIAQNERTLFNYLSGNESFALINKMQSLTVGDFIYPSDIYNYFMNGGNLSNDFLTIRALSESYNALERIADTNTASVKLLKTIALFNIAGGNITASKHTLALCDKNYAKNTQILLDKSIITYRKFNGEYRIWQGSDFNINLAISEQLANVTGLDIAQHLNDKQVFLPFVAKRYSIENHSLFYFETVFINANQHQNIAEIGKKPRVIFVLNFNSADTNTFNKKIVNYFDKQDICVLVNNSEQIKTASKYCAALENIAAQNAVIQQDPVIHHEFTQYLINAKQQETLAFNQILNNPENSLWFNQTKPAKCHNKKAVQALFSTVLEDIYPETPIIKNELINRDNPSAQANAGRKKLLFHLLNHADKADLAIDKFPAEKSMYIALFKESGMHQKIDGQWKIQPPTEPKYRAIWQKIDNFFNQSNEQARNLSNLNEVLSAPPFGIKKPVLPIFYIANYLYNKDEIALYEDRNYVPYFTNEHLERFLKRPDTFTFQQFKIEGITQSFLQEYENGLLDGENAPSAVKLFQAMAVFIQDIPPYTKQTKNISKIAQQVRDAFKNNKSPQDLLFKKLPEACGFDSNAEGFGEVIKTALQEIKNAYAVMFESKVNILSDKLNEKENIKLELIRYGQALKQYSFNNSVENFIKNISNDFGNLDEYLERVLSALIDKPINNWNDQDVTLADRLLVENINLVVNLYAVHVQNSSLNKKDEKIKNEILALLKKTEDKLGIVGELVKEVDNKIVTQTLKVI